MTAYSKLIASDVRRSPDKQLIEQIRQRYPTEKEIDRILTRKMTLRSGPGYKPVPLETMVSGVQKLIEKNLGYPVKVANAKWLSGGASKLQMVFDLHWHGMDKSSRDVMETKLVLRMEPPASVTESSRRREFQVIKAVEGIIPVPPTYWMDADAEFLPHPAIIYGFAHGVAKPSKDSNKVSGLGQNYGPELRKKLIPQFVDLLAKIHNIDVNTLHVLKDFERPTVGSNAAVIKQVNYCRRMWEEDRLEEEPLMEIAYQWLIKNAPPIDHVSLVHGDYRSGNFLFDEDKGIITAWLDWEGACLGDRHRDLTYASLYTFQHLAEDGKTPLASGMLPPEELYKAYEKASGLSVDPARIVYYGVFNRYLATALSLGASARAANGEKTHQDVLLNFVAGIGYPILADLRDYFEQFVEKVAT